MYYNVHVRSIVVRSYPALRPDGSSWDKDGSGPDLLLAFVDDGILYHYLGHVAWNATPSMLPWTWISDTKQNFINNLYDVRIYNIDSANSIDDDLNDELMDYAGIKFTDATWLKIYPSVFHLKGKYGSKIDVYTEWY